MNRITTLVLALLAVVAWLVIRSLGEPPEPVRARPPLIPEAILSDLQEIELTLFSKEILRLRREPGGHFVMDFGRDATGEKWIYHDEVKQELVEQLLTAIDDSWRDVLQGSASEDDFLRTQLIEPKYRLVARSSSGECSLGYGEDVAGTQDIYAREAGADEIFTTGRQVPNLLDLNVQDWREDDLFPFTSQTVTAVEIVRLDEEGSPARFAARRSGALDWEIQEPEGLKADPAAVQSLIHRATTLRVKRFVGLDFENPQLNAATGFPDDPQGYLTLQSGSVSATLEIGKGFAGEEVAARDPARGETMTFTVDAELLDSVFRVDFQDLRSRRLTPAIESSMVGLQCARPGGEVVWRVARGGEHPRGKWQIREPLEAAVHEGLAPHSWPQVVADFDRLEVTEFLAEDHAFAPELVVTVEWRSDQFLRSLEVEVARDGDSTLARASDRKGEILRLPLALWNIATLHPELYQSRQVLPPADQALATITEYRFLPRTGNVIHLRKKPGQNAPEALVDPDGDAARLTSAVSLLCGYQAEDLVLAEEVEAPGFEDSPFTLELETAEGPFRLRVGRETADGFYCSVEPRFPGVLVLIRRARLQDFLEL